MPSAPKITPRTPLPYQVRAELFLQLCQLERAGMPYDRAILGLDLPKKYSARISAMHELALRGVDPSHAGEQSGVFTKMEARLVRAALQAGSPMATYKRLADHCAARAREISDIKSKLAYPVFLFVMALVIQPLPKLVSGALSIWGYVWHVVRPFVFFALAAWIYKHTLYSAGPSDGKSWQQYVPIWNRLYVKRNLRDFFSALALMLEAGVSMLDALPAALEVVEDGDIRKDLVRLRQRIERGSPFAPALLGLKYVSPGRLTQFAQTGEQSGTLSEMLARHVEMESEEISAFYARLAEWSPRIVYVLVVIMIVTGLLGGSGVSPKGRIPE